MGDFEKQNDLYLWNHVWYIFSVSTTVGYGDVHASTQAGRLVSVVVSVVSMLMIALLTSSFMVKLSYSDAEVAASIPTDAVQFVVDSQATADGANGIVSEGPAAWVRRMAAGLATCC